MIEDGHAVARIEPCEEITTERRTEALLAILQGSVEHYEAPAEPVGEGDWEALQC